MRTFEELFPDFVNSCDKLHQHLVPVALAILVLSFAFFFWSAPQQPFELVKFVGKLFLIVMLITHADFLIDHGQDLSESFVQNNVDARPENVALLYRQKVAKAQNDPERAEDSWWDMLFSSTFFEAIIYALLVLISWLAMAVQFFISILQSVALKICWVLSPILFACFAIPLISGLALRHILRIVGILLWPMGLALAATITGGLLGMQTEQVFFADATVEGNVRYVIVNLLSVGVVAIWILFSTFLAPGVMQRLVAGSSDSANLISRAGHLLGNMAVPFLGAAVASALSATSRALHRSTDEGPPASLITPEPMPDSPTTPPVLRKPSDDDPTAENAVRNALDQSDDQIELWNN